MSLRRLKIGFLIQKHRMDIKMTSHLNDILQDIKTHFSEIIDFMIYYDSINEDEKAWDIIYVIEDLAYDDIISLTLDDFNKRTFESATLLYDFMLCGIINNEEIREILIQKLLQNENKNFLNYLESIKENDGSEADANIDIVLNRCNLN